MPITVCDLSNGPDRGTIYINWSDQRNGAKNTDIWIAKSTDKGMSWSKPTRVNDDSTKTQQFLSWMAIDQTNGYLYIVYYDRRKYRDSKTDVYLARSKDGGNTFVNLKISQRNFKPDNKVFMGDYNNITAYNNIVRPMWTSIDDHGGLSVWTALIDVKDFDKIEMKNKLRK